MLVDDKLRNGMDFEVLKPDGTLQALRLERPGKEFSRKPLVSCLMVSRGDPRIARHSIQCYLRQDYDNRELVIVSNAASREFEEFLQPLASAGVRLVKAPKGLSIGELRNFTVAHAKGELLCQWDDDDLSDPLRLSISIHALLAAQAGAVFLSQWLVWWPARKWLAISARRVWEPSILTWRNILPIYPAMAQGSDTVVTAYIKAIHNVVLLNEAYLYCYVITGLNIWGEQHFEGMFRASQRVHRGDAEYARAIELLATRTPALEYAAALANIPGSDSLKRPD